MIQLFDATFHSTAGELELMMRISDNITRGGGGPAQEIPIHRK